MDAYFNALILLVNLHPRSFSPTLVTLLAKLYQRVQTFMLGDVARLITVLKSTQVWWISLSRGAENKPSDDVAALEQFNYQDAQVLVDVKRYRDELLNTISAEDLHLFDMFIYSFLNIHRVIVMPEDLNFSTITNAPTVDTSNIPHIDWKGVTSSLGFTANSFKSRYDAFCVKQGHEIFTTAGPNGKASWTAFSDAKVILGNTTLFNHYKNFVTESKMSFLLRDIFGTVSIPNADQTIDSLLKEGVIHSFSEWGGKTRHVAMLDYWTQIALTPLHNTIFETLRDIPEDATFNQDAAIADIKRWTLDPLSELHSLDLTAATDRLPIAFQREVLSYLLSSTSLPTHWAGLLVEREFTTTNAKKIKYAVGQPMGARSSWGMLALTHHIIIQQAARNAKVALPFWGYRILGDDIVINSTAVAMAYRAIMHALGVSISQTKSILAISSARPAAEFGKRVFIEGRELTAIPTKLVTKCITNGRLAPQLQNEFHRRGLFINNPALFTFFASILDHESLEFILILNAVPGRISGLTGPIRTDHRIFDFATWYSEGKLTEDQMIQAYTYVACTEQLKRMDALLQNSQMIMSAIEEHTAGYHTQSVTSIGWSYSESDSIKAKLVQGLPKFSPMHPIVKASVTEMDRIGSQLSLLRTGDSALTERAREGLIDSFRNVLASHLPGAKDANALADRSLLQRTLDLLNKVVPGYKAGDKLIHFVEYTALLAYIQRLWRVRWEFGERMTINAVKSRVEVSATLSEAKLLNAFNSISIRGRDLAKVKVDNSSVNTTNS
jgi:hypothetical protein